MLGLFPKKLTPTQLQKTVVLWLSLALLIMLIINIMRVNSFEKEQRLNVFDKQFSKIELDESESEEFKNLKLFESGNYCGWNFIQEKDKIKTEKSSEHFASKNGDIIIKNDGGITFSVCLNKTSKNTQIIFALIAYAIIFLIVYPKFPKEIDLENEPENEQKIPSTTEG